MEEVRRTNAVQFMRSSFSSPFPALRQRASKPAWRDPVVVLLLALVAIIGLTACTTERGNQKRLLERVPPPQPLLTASARFGEGTLAVQAWLGPSVRLRKADGQPDAAEKGPRAGGRRDRLEGPSSQPSDYFDRTSAPFEQGTNDYSKEEIDEMYGRVNYQSILPPRLALTFTFVNTSTQTITLTIAEVNSLLGNFAPRPEKVTLAPGQEGSIDPMLSTFDNNFEELDVTLTLRRGGKGETQVLKLRRVQPSPPPAPVIPHPG